MDNDGYKQPIDEKKVKFRLNLLDSNKENMRWILIITISSFFLSATLSLVSSRIMENVNVGVAFCVVIVIILVNIIFDIIGTAVTAADEPPFHAMASRKRFGARQAIRLIRNADKVSNFCNDVVGDICGVISGAASTYIVLKLVGEENIYKIILDLTIAGFVAAMTVGGKAVGKSLAIENSNYIIYKVGVILKLLKGKIDFSRVKSSRKKTSQRKRVDK